jgi:phosphate transport system protein
MTIAVRVNFEKQLRQLQDDTLLLGSLAHQAVARAVKALVEGDVDLARTVVAEDVGVNRLHYDVEMSCYGLLATEQPVARDLRTIVSALSIANDLERIGDHGKRIARIMLRMTERPQPIPLGDIPYMGDRALDMLGRALQAVAQHDVELARALCRDDDYVDALYKQTFNITLSYMLDKPQLISAGTHLIQIAHELERVGDRSTNVAERVIYAATGALVDLNV